MIAFLCILVEQNFTRLLFEKPLEYHIAYWE